MALIQCPECGTQVSEKASSCPKCAYPLRPNLPEQPLVTPKPTVIVKSKEGCFLQTLNTGCMVIAVIAAITALSIFVGFCSRL
jgi:hypothetical protein